MLKLLRGLLLLFLLVSMAGIVGAEAPQASDFSSNSGLIVAQAGDESDTATVRVIPDDGEVGEDFIILVSDLSANESITIRIVYVETEAIVYETNRNANERGRVEIEIFTESSDATGEYLVEVSNASGVVIATTELTLEEPSGRDGVLVVSPTEAEAGTNFVLEISEVQPFADLLILITDEAGTEIFRTAVRATVDGTASIEYPSNIENTGVFTIQVLQNQTISVASGSLTVQGILYPATVLLDPNPSLPEGEVFVTVSGLEADTAATVVISNETGTILSQDITANVSGLAVFSFMASPEMPLGTYQVQVISNDTVLAQSEWLLEIPAITVSVTPPVGIRGSNFLVEVNNLQPNESVVAELLQDETVLQSYTITGDAEGYARAVLGPRLRLQEGQYIVRVLRSGEVAFQQGVSIVAEREIEESSTINPEDVSISISPESAPRPTSYAIHIEGLPADTDVTLNILFDGRVVFTFDATANSDGVIDTGINSEESDPVGTYTLQVRAEGQIIGSVNFEIADEEAQIEPTPEPTEEAPETPNEAVSVRVEPEAVVQGERFEIFVTNLNPEETVTVELRLNGESVYSSEQTANAAGALAIALRTEEGDEIGQYEVVVLRDTEEIATSSFSIVESTASVSRAEMSISPESAPQGSTHTISITGLQAGETVQVTVTAAGDEVFSTQREADAEGAVTIVLRTSAEDFVGQHNVSVTRANGGLTGSFTVTESNVTVEEPTTAELAISVDPSSAELGETHTIVVNGLEAEEAVSATVEYAGEVVYETRGAANADGVYTLILATGEGDEAGDYTVTVTNSSDESVSVSFTVIGEEAPSEESNLSLSIEPSAITANETFELRVTGLDAEETVEIVIFFDGESVYESSVTANPSGALSLPLVIEDSDPVGTYTAEIRRSNGESISADFIVTTAEEPGQEENNGEEGGIDLPQPETGRVAINQSYEGSVSADSPEASYSFAGEEGQFVVIEATSSSFDTYLLLLDADGTEIAYDDDGAGNLNSRISISLPETGEYTVIVTSYSYISYGETVNGDFVLFIESAETSETSYGQSLEIAISPETPSHYIEFEAEAGDVISVRVDSAESVDTTLSLIDPDGVIIVSDDDSGAGFDPEIERVTLANDGTYRLILRPFTFGTSGTVQITVDKVAESTLDSGTNNVVLNSKQNTQILIFEGRAGEVVDLVITLESGGVGDFYVSADQDGATLMNYQSYGMRETITLSFRVPDDGTVRVHVEEYSGTNLAFKLELVRD